MKRSLRGCHGPWVAREAAMTCVRRSDGCDVKRHRSARLWLRAVVAVGGPGSRGHRRALGTNLDHRFLAAWSRAGQAGSIAVPCRQAQELMVGSSRRSCVAPLADACAGCRYAPCPDARSVRIHRSRGEYGYRSRLPLRQPSADAVCLFGSGKGRGRRDRAAFSALSRSLWSTRRQRRSPARRRVAVRADC